MECFNDETPLTQEDEMVTFSVPEVFVVDNFEEARV